MMYYYSTDASRRTAKCRKKLQYVGYVVVESALPKSPKAILHIRGKRKRQPAQARVFNPFLSASSHEEAVATFVICQYSLAH